MPTKRSKRSKHTRRTKQTRLSKLRYGEWRRFLRRYAVIMQKDTTPASLQLNEESHESFKVLQHMAKLGFLTNNSQEGLQEPPEPKLPADPVLYVKTFSKAANVEYDNPKDLGRAHERLYKRKGGKYVPNVDKQPGLSERAYVSGLMSVDLARLFVHFVNKGDKIAFVVGRSIPVTYAYGGGPVPTMKLLPHEVPVATVQQVNGGTGCCHDMPTWVENDLEPYPDMPIFRHAKKARKKLSKYDPMSLVAVECIDPVHGRSAHADDGLFTEVLQCLERARAAFKKAK
jgi:hypothetical protein